VVRVGFGSDSHRFERSFSKPLVLGGIQISDAGGLEANSDGDVILHACFNAMSQAVGENSIGYYADPLYKQGITDSRKYMKVAMDLVRTAGCRVHNLAYQTKRSQR
jgi:2-C-methyl-D-erythritol 2,4-cyclodiphosphate synthase